MICEGRETDEKSLLILINDIYTIVFGVWHSSFYLQHKFLACTTLWVASIHVILYTNTIFNRTEIRSSQILYQEVH